jgi:hypothetical protein
LSLTPRPQVILFGDEPGIRETCTEFSLLHVSDVSKNEFGTPLLNDIFEKAESLSEDGLLCYINADILLMSDFSAALAAVAGKKDRFLMGARPWNLDVNEEIRFDGDWEPAIAERAVGQGSLRSERSCDFFVFSRGLWGSLPPFAIGRAYFDNVLLHRTRRLGAALVDATPSVISVHQNHGYASHLGGANMLDNVEAQRNVSLAGSPSRRLTWKSATYVVQRGVLHFNLLGCLRFFGPWSRFSQLWQRVRDAIYPGKHLATSRS